MLDVDRIPATDLGAGESVENRTFLSLEKLTAQEQRWAWKQVSRLETTLEPVHEPGRLRAESFASWHQGAAFSKSKSGTPSYI